MNLANIRAWQRNIMSMNIHSYELLLGQFDSRTFTTYRDGGDGWTVTQVLGHLRDFEAVFFERARLTVSQENPPLPFPDPDEQAAERDYHAIGWGTLLDEWKSDRAAHLAFLEDRAEDDWERIGQHPKRGPFSLHDQLFLTTLHDSIHLEQIAKILAATAK